MTISLDNNQGSTKNYQEAFKETDWSILERTMMEVVPGIRIESRESLQTMDTLIIQDIPLFCQMYKTKYGLRESDLDIFSFNPFLAEYILRNQIGHLILFSVEEFGGKSRIDMLLIDVRTNRIAHARYTKTVSKKQNQKYLAEILKTCFKKCIKYDYCKEIYGLPD